MTSKNRSIDKYIYINTFLSRAFQVSGRSKTARREKHKRRPVSYGLQKQQQNPAELSFVSVPKTLIGQSERQSTRFRILLAQTYCKGGCLCFRTRVNSLVTLNVNQDFSSVIGPQVC